MIPWFIPRNKLYGRWNPSWTPTELQDVPKSLAKKVNHSIKYKIIIFFNGFSLNGLVQQIITSSLKESYVIGFSAFRFRVLLFKSHTFISSKLSIGFAVLKIWTVKPCRQHNNLMYNLIYRKSRSRFLFPSEENVLQIHVFVVCSYQLLGTRKMYQLKMLSLTLAQMCFRQWPHTFYLMIWLTGLQRFLRRFISCSRCHCWMCVLYDSKLLNKK